MRDSNTNRSVLADVPAGLTGVVRRDAARYSFHCPPEHRKLDASVEIWPDAEGRIGACCHDCVRSREPWQRITRPGDDPPDGRLRRL